jgi:PAS domain S-box-containing protein
MGKNEVYNNKELLKHALKKFRALFDGIDELIYVSHPDTYEILFANTKLTELAGEEILGKKCYKVFHNLSHPCSFCTNKYIFGENLGKTYIWEQQNGRNKRWYKCIDKAIEWPRDKHVRFAMAIDITEHKKAEEALRESEEKYRNLFENASDPIITLDREGNVISINKIVEEYGYKRSELIGKNMLNFIPKKYWPKIGKHTIDVLRGKIVQAEVEVITKKGNIFAEYRSKPIKKKGKVVGAQVILRDVTGRKGAEERLKESEEKYRFLYENSTIVNIIIGIDGIIKDVNKTSAKKFGYSKDEIVGKHVLEFVVPEQKEKVAAELERSLKGEDTPESDFDIYAKDGSIHTLLFSSGQAVLYEEDQPTGVLLTGMDITERKKAEEALKKSEGLFRSVVENSHDGIVILDDNFRIVYANDECASIGGYSREEILGQDFRKFLGKESKLVKRRYLQRQNGEKAPSTYELKIVRKDGKKRDIKVKSVTIQDSQGRVRTITQILDITDLKRMEKERERFEERLSALNKYGQSLNMAESLEDVYKVTLRAMEKTLGFEYASILLVQGKTLQLVSQRGYSKQLSLNMPLDGEKGVTIKAARTGKPIFVPDIRNEKTYILGKPNMLSELAVPIKVEKQVLGVLNVESKKLAAFDDEDRGLLEILASHAAIAISDIKRHEELGKLSKRLANLMKSSTEIMHVEDMHQRLKVIAKAIRNFGWRRVVISLRDENLEGTTLVTSGLTKEETKLLLKRKAPGHIWRERLGPKFERFKKGEFYYLPWSDPWIREYVHRVPPEVSPEEATTYAGVPSRLSSEEMVDWHPQDMLYAPLRTPEGRIVGILSMDDPVDGRKPTGESLAPLELFLHQAAMVIENAQLIESLREARKQLEVYAEQLEQKVEERTRELKKSQEQLLKAQRLGVIGELAGMVGHDLRNPLTSINGAAYYLKKRLGSKIDGKVKEMLDLIEKNIVYSNKIINDLLDYSREIKLDLTESKPKSIIKEALSLVEIPKNIQVINLTGNGPKIKVDVGKIKRAFVNIIKNAVEAMPKGGTLTIKSKKLNGSLDLVFSDTGVGMSKKTVKKLWTPLFTTKAKGMGFGLAICKRVVEAHGGSISVKSVRGKGTTFTVTIPTRPKIEGGEKVWVKPLESSLLTMTKT